MSDLPARTSLRRASTALSISARTCAGSAGALAAGLAVAVWAAAKPADSIVTATAAAAHRIVFFIVLSLLENESGRGRTGLPGRPVGNSASMGSLQRVAALQEEHERERFDVAYNGLPRPPFGPARSGAAPRSRVHFMESLMSRVRPAWTRCLLAACLFTGLPLPLPRPPRPRRAWPRARPGRRRGRSSRARSSTGAASGVTGSGTATARPGRRRPSSRCSTSRPRRAASRRCARSAGSRPRAWP